MRFRTNRTKRTRVVNSIALVAVLGATSLSGGPAAAQADAEYEVDRLTTGYWRGYASAGGVVTGSVEGLTTFATGFISADFDFAALGDADEEGAAVGSWNHSGKVDLNFNGIIEGQAINGGGTLNASGSDGTLEGSTQLLFLDGDTRTTGNLSATAAGATVNIPIDNLNPVPTLEVSVLGGSCELVHGDWVYSLENEISGGGLTASFVGSWTAIRDSQRPLDGEIDELLESVFDRVEGAPIDIEYSGSTMFDRAADVMGEMLEFTESPAGRTTDQVLALLTEAEAVLVELRADSGCERIYLADGVEQFDTLLTYLVAEMIVVGIELARDGSGEMPPETWQLLANTAARTGALGSGAPDAERAARAETALIFFAEDELNAQLDDDGALPITDTVIRYVGTSAIMGWDLTIDGVASPASEIWADLVGGQ